MKIKLYHNPRCSKSRETLTLLQQKGYEPKIIEYLSTPPTVSELKKILALLGFQPRELMRTKEAIFKDLNLADDSRSTQELLQAMVDNPILIERPIVVANNRAALGRPPERILDIL